MSRIAPRRVGVAVAAGLALALAASCTGVTEETAPDDAARGGDLTVGLQIAPKTLDPIFGDAPDLDRNTLNLFYETLVRIDAGGVVVPVLADSYEVSDDGLTYTFQLRDGVTFHDGTAFDAAAVVANLDRVRDPAVNSPRTPDLAAVASVEAVDDSTVTIVLAQSSGSFLAALAGEAGMMVSPTALADPSALQRQPVGTGPFVFDGFTNGQDITAVANEDYWGEADGEPLPLLDSVTMRVIPDANVKLTDLKTGGVQLIDTVPVREVASLETSGDLQVIDGRGVQKWMAFNTERAPFDDVRVRRAISMAIDNEAISQAITNGQGVVNATLCTQSELCFDETLEPVAHDVEQARHLLADAGVTDLHVELSVINREPDNTIAQLVQAQLAEVGVTLSIETLERQKWIESVLQERDFDLATLQIGVPRLDPSLAFNGTFAADAAQNWSGVTDEAMFAAVAEAGSAPGEEERRAAYAEAQRIILDQAYYHFFYWNTDPAGASTALRGLTGDQSGAWNLSAAYLEQ